MRTGAGYAESFNGIVNSYNRITESSLDTYQTGRENGGMGSYNMDDIGYFKSLGIMASVGLFGNGAGASGFQNSTLSAIFKRLTSFGMMGGAGIGGYSMEYMNVSIPTMADALCDPLVVNIGSDTADVRDQTFKFDLDADGREDEISMLGKGSGFLALDKNGNGKIDDGSELFGTKSGDGFADLREYDSDGNGWIDENDEVFSKLKVWCKDENGRDVLMDLKQADIGAIYLGEQQTEFSLGGEDGYRDGVIRSTGVFLRESTGAGTVQHVDMSLKQNGSGIRVSGDDTRAEIRTDTNRGRQSNAARRREERRRQEKTRKKKADEKAAADALYKKRLERRKYLNELQAEHDLKSEKIKSEHLEKTRLIL